MTRKRHLLNQIFGLVDLQVERTGKSWRLVEPEQLKRFLVHFDVDCVFDVGANEGQYASMLRSTGYRGLIISFEPNPVAASSLQHRAEKDAHWVIKQLALDSVGRQMDFNVMASSQFSSLHAAGQSAAIKFKDEMRITQAITIDTVPLDEVYQSLKSEYGFQRPFLKLDTQGHDVEVVRGAADCIGEFVGLQSELALTNIYANSPDYHTALEYYQSLGFRISGLIPNNEGHFPDLLETDCLMYRSQAS